MADTNNKTSQVCGGLPISGAVESQFVAETVRTGAGLLMAGSRPKDHPFGGGQTV